KLDWSSAVGLSDLVGRRPGHEVVGRVRMALGMGRDLGGPVAAGGVGGGGGDVAGVRRAPETNWPFSFHTARSSASVRMSCAHLSPGMLKAFDAAVAVAVWAAVASVRVA